MINKSEVGDIIQRIYDSEINLHIGYCWDGGFDFSLYNTPYALAGIPENKIQYTGKDKIEEAMEIIVSSILEEYPNSVFTGWYKNKQSNS